ncbi:hypothetical protein KY284_036289 [Solanum tuberosum]|nr:hypothetical protein KY284_036289 [Solanum tuberosum]
MTHYQNIFIGRNDFDLNETINESDCGLPQQDRNIAPSYGLDNYFGQSSHFEMTENVGTSSNFHVSPTFDADDYRENITQDEPIDHVNIDDRDLPNYGSPSASDSDDLPNAEESGDNVPFEASSNGPNIFGDTHDEYSSQLGRYIKEHTCDMGTCRDGHFNLDVEMIANVLRVDIEKTPRFPIKDCQTSVLKAYGISISRRKSYLGRKRAFEKVYGTWEGSLAELLRFMEALKHFNPGTIVEWKTERRVDVIEDVFNYVFWTFKPCIDGFVFCRPIISIDGTHVYGKYDIKLLIAIATDGNGSILPLAFAIVANESMETWSLFLDHLHLHVVKGRRDVALISDRHHGILSSVYNSPNWQAPFGFHRFCLRHLKANFQKKFKNVTLNNLLWAAANHYQEKKFLEKMKMIKEINPEAYVWLMKNDLDKWTLHRDGGRRWGMLTTNSSESFNGLLKSARGLPVTAMVRLTYNQIVNRFVTRSKFVNQLVQQKQQWMPKPFMFFEDN